MSKKYYVDDIVCDYGVYYPNEPENELICVCNLKSNAELIAAILNTDNEEVSTCWRDKKLDELKQQLAKKDEQIKILNARLKEYDQDNQRLRKIMSKDSVEKLLEIHTKLEEKDKEVLDWKDGTMICNYEKMLAEKDKEIETLKSIGGNLIWKDIDRNKQLKDQRHEICEKIRETFENEATKQKNIYGIDNIELRFAYIGNLLGLFDWRKLLDQIEKGDKNGQV